MKTVVLKMETHAHEGRQFTDVSVWDLPDERTLYRALEEMPPSPAVGTAERVKWLEALKDKLYESGGRLSEDIKSYWID